MIDTLDRFKKALMTANVEITEVNEFPFPAASILKGTAIAGNGKEVEVIVGTNGCINIQKPNGTSKWYYEKSPAQTATLIKQVCKSYYR